MLQTVTSRRRFLGSMAALLTMPAAVSTGQQPRRRRVAANDRVQVGIVGLGSRGFNLLDEFLAADDARVVALCDVDSIHHRDLAWGKGRAMGLEPAAKLTAAAYARKRNASAQQQVLTTADFRELCDHPGIDAIVVATPDHWHALCTLTALRAGKDVYCEKPVTHTFHEGQQIYRAVARHKAVFQTGSQQRSAAEFRLAVDLVRNGHLGEIQRVEVGLPPGYDKPQGDTNVVTPPDHLDYDLWCGPAEKLPYMRARHHRWWRGHRAYGGGVLMDWIGHHNDIAHWALGMDQSGPEQIEAVNWTFPESTVYNTPHQYTIQCRYAGGIQSEISSRHPVGTRLIGTNGWLFVTRGRIESSEPAWLKPGFAVGADRVLASPGHVRNFLDCVRSRQPCIAPAETAHRSITPGHLAYVSEAVGRPLRWDARAEKIIDDPAADQLLQSHSYRDPWTIDSGEG